MWYTVYNISWAGLHIAIAKFFTKKEALEFIAQHKDYTLIIKEE